MSYPEDPLVVKLEAATTYDLTADPSTYTWLDITPDWHEPIDVLLTVGAADEQAETNSELRFSLRNLADPDRASVGASQVDGRYTDDNPLSDLFEVWGQGTPIRLTVAGTVRTIQYVGALTDEWPGQVMTPHFVLTHVECGGLFRRLTQGQAKRSAMHRSAASTRVAVRPQIYLPLESLDFTSTEVQTMASEGQIADITARFSGRGLIVGVDDGPPGGAHAPVWPWPGNNVTTTVGLRQHRGASMRADFPTFPTSTGFWGMALAFKGTGPDVPVASTSWELELPDSAGGLITLSIADLFFSSGLGDGTGINLTPTGGAFAALTGYQIGDARRVFDGQWHYLVFTLTQSGGSVTGRAWLDGFEDPTISPHTTTATLTYPIGLDGPFPISIGTDVQSDNTQTSVMLSHIELFSDSAMDPDALYSAFLAYRGEAAHTRIARICVEDGIPSAITGTVSAAMGPQAIESVVPIVRDAGAVDRGILTDHLGVIGYRCFQTLCNQTAGITLSGAGRQIFAPFQPVTDDSVRRNQIAATAYGQTVTVSQDAGALGTTKIGVYDAQINPNVADVGQLPGQAGWTVHIGTVFGKRYPSATLDMLRAPGLVTSWLAHALGDVFTITSPPRASAPADISLMSRGWAETISGRRRGWRAVVNSVRADPYNVFVVQNGSGNRSRLGGVGTRLVSAVSNSATALTVLEPGDGTLPPDRWVDTVNYASSFPFGITVAGEDMTVTAIADIFRDAFTGRTDASGWGTPQVGGPYTLTGTAANFSTGTGTAKITPGALNSDRFVTFPTTTADNVLRGEMQYSTLPASGTMRVGLTPRWADASNHYICELTLTSALVLTARIVKRLAGVETVVATATLHPAQTITTGTWFSMVAYAIGSTITLRTWRRDRTTSGGATFTNRQAPLPDLTVTDPGTLLTGSHAGFFGRNETAVTTNDLRFDNTRLDSPQTFTVTRAVNGIIKAQVASAAIALTRPGVYSL